jgi:hypothetical protein
MVDKLYQEVGYWIILFRLRWRWSRHVWFEFCRLEKSSTHVQTPFHIWKWLVGGRAHATFENLINSTTEWNWL